MRILIGCEYSGIVRDAFAKKGHHAVSCDLLPTESEGLHVQGNILDILNDGWEMMIAFPPCTYLSNCGNAHFNFEKKGLKAVQRVQKRLEALEFFKTLWNAPIKSICLENPVGFINRNYMRPTQTIHPYFFGNENKKRTCLWLKNLPPLFHAKQDDLFAVRTHVNPAAPKYSYVGSDGRVRNTYFVEGCVGGDAGQKERSKFFLEVAEAMAAQWG